MKLASLNWGGISLITSVAQRALSTRLPDHWYEPKESKGLAILGSSSFSLLVIDTKCTHVCSTLFSVVANSNASTKMLIHTRRVKFRFRGYHDDEELTSSVPVWCRLSILDLSNLRIHTTYLDANSEAHHYHLHQYLAVWLWNTAICPNASALGKRKFWLESAVERR